MLAVHGGKHQVPAPQLLIQLPAEEEGKDGSSAWALETHRGGLGRVQGSWLLPGPGLAVARHLGSEPGQRNI